MVACRITEARNSHCRTGSASSSHVPLNKHRRNGVPGLNILSTMLRWIWPAERCTNCQSIYSITKPSDMLNKNIDRIKRSNDGRFVITYGSDIDIYRPTSAKTDISNSSESDDGGFLPQQKSKLRTSWRRPLVSCPSELSFSPIVQTSRRASHDGLLRIGSNNEQPLLQIVPIEHHPIPPTYQNIDSIDRNPVIIQHNRNILMQPTPSSTTSRKLTRIVSSSPAISSPMAIDSSTLLLSPQTMYFNDLSSVLQSSSRDPSLPTSQHANISQLRMLQERYAQELPSLRAIHEETRRMVQQNAHQTNEQIPLQCVTQSNSSQTSSKEFHIHHMPHHPHHQYHDHYHNQQPHFEQQQQQQQQQQLPLIHQRFKSKLLPRHYRLARSAPELASPNQSHDMNTTLRPFEITPESQSSSSGFGSRNTSQTHTNQTLRTAAINSMGQQQNVRNLPPYRSPPAPKYIYYPYEAASSTSQHSSPYTMDHWLDLFKMSGSNYLMADNAGLDAKAVDVCSVDGPYEFDPATPTPTASTPTGLARDELFSGTPRDLVLPHSQFALLQTQSLQPYQRKRVSKYENVEARVQAMKEEFHAYRKRHAMQMQQHTTATANNATAT